MTKLPFYFILLIISVVSLGSLAFAQSDSSAGDVYRAELHEEILQAQKSPIPMKKGDRCIVCGLELDEKDFVLQLRGRRVPVKKSAYEELLNNPVKYFSKLQPKSALFTEALRVSKFSWEWIGFGVLVLLLLLSGALSSVMALRRKLDPTKWFFIGLFGNIFAPLYLLTKKIKLDLPAGFNKIARTSLPSNCPVCGATNHPSAQQCSMCGESLVAKTISEVQALKGES